MHERAKKAVPFLSVESSRSENLNLAVSLTDIAHTFPLF